MVQNKVNYKKIYAIKKANEERILKVCPNCPNTSGIYFLTREEDGFKYAYIGQAIKLRERLASHLSGYQHIDLSIKKHGLWSEKNITGYKVNFLEFAENILDEMEQKYIKQYANAGYQLRNATSGSQGSGKKGLTMRDRARDIMTELNKARKILKDLFQTFSRNTLIISQKKNLRLNYRKRHY